MKSGASSCSSRRRSRTRPRASRAAWRGFGGSAVNQKKYVVVTARLMREAGLRGCMRGKRKRTTRRDRNAVAAPDLVGRKFAADAPNKLWLADITCVKTDEGFLYLAFLIDAHSRRVSAGRWRITSRQN